MLTAEQLETRKTGIGGSEIAAVLGESRFASPFDVWLSKTQGWVLEETEDMRRGSFLEDGIGRWYADRFGVAAERFQSSGTIRHKARPVALCTPDRIVVQPERDRLVSIKAPRRGGDLWGEPGTDAVPPEYLLQLQWEHAIYSSAGIRADEEMHLAALVDGDLAVYITRADLELQSWMLDYAEQWWARHVVGGEQPSLDGSSQAKEWLRRKFKDEGEKRPATPAEVRLCVELQMFEEQAAFYESEAEDRRNALRLSMGAAQEIQAPNGVVRWKADKNGKRSFKPKWNQKEQS